MTPLDREGACPQCGARIVFPFAAAAAQVCRYCRFVVLRTDRDWIALGKVADLLPLPAPLPVGTIATLGAERFRVAGRVQYDRADASSAPWQELFVAYASGAWGWLALAQGRWYVTGLAPAGPLPSFQQAAPGSPVAMPGGATWMVAERGARRLVSAEGELPFAIRPGETEWYADLSGPAGGFGTIDYGDGASAPALFVGQVFDPSLLRVEMLPSPVAAPEVRTASLVCPGCGGALPLVAAGSAERIVCRYCGMQSDVAAGALVALGKLSLPAVAPEMPLGSRGLLRGIDLIFVGFMVRGTTVEEERYRWREYLLYAPATSSYVFLVEEDGAFEYVTPASAGDLRIADSERSVYYQGRRFGWQQSVQAEVEQVVGEFYWKVEAGETVTATEFRSSDGSKLNAEKSPSEIVWSYSTPLPRAMLRRAFGVAARAEPPEKADRRRRWAKTAALLVLGWSVITGASCAAKRNQVIYNASIPITPVLAAGTSPPAGAGDDDDKIARGRPCREWHQIGVTLPECAASLARGTSSAATVTPSDSAFFTPVFAIDRDRRSLLVELSAPSLVNTWVGSDVALVRDDSGEVEEASIDLEYYQGVEGGESWTEGSREGSVWFSRIASGRYFLRIDPAWEPGKLPPALNLRIVHDTWSEVQLLGSLAGLVAVLMLGWFVENRSR